MVLTDAQVQLLLNDLIDRYGYDFTGYSEASLRRRITRIFALDRFPGFDEFRFRINNDIEYFRRVVEELTVNVTEMLRDPGFYKTLREEVIPVLATYPFIRVWHAGCSTGEEVYSMAILLKEANLLHKSRLYATDINPSVIEKARKGIFPASQMRKYSENYIQSGGTMDFSSYYTSNYNLAKFDSSLGKRWFLPLITSCRIIPSMNSSLSFAAIHLYILTGNYRVKCLNCSIPASTYWDFLPSAPRNHSNFRQ